MRGNMHIYMIKCFHVLRHLLFSLVPYHRMSLICKDFVLIEISSWVAISCNTYHCSSWSAGDRIIWHLCHTAEHQLDRKIPNPSQWYVCAPVLIVLSGPPKSAPIFVLDHNFLFHRIHATSLELQIKMHVIPFDIMPHIKMHVITYKVLGRI